MELPLLSDQTALEAATSRLPLCVDLDGTLIRSDLLMEGVLAAPLNIHVLLGLVALTFSGRAAFKHRVAKAAPLDPALLPYNETLLAWLQGQKMAGRSLVLVTAADSAAARSVADYLGLFDEVIASDGINNLKGKAKARVLAERFGVGRFTYVGDSRADLPVWQIAGSGVIVNAPHVVASSARRLVTVEAEIEDRDSLATALVQEMRPYQWIKNILVFVPIFTAHATSDLSGWIRAAVLFVGFCATASGIYFLNDLMDLTADRRHPRKCRRPFARGAVPLHLGAILAGMLLLTGMVLGAEAGAFAVLLLYAIISVSYSMGLKEKPLVDVFLLAALYTIRLFGGGEATGHHLSLWLLGFSSFLFLDLALVKRVGEMMQCAARNEQRMTRRGYRPDDINLIQMLGCCAAFASSLVLALFVQSEARMQIYASPGLLWGIVPLMLFWQCRIWLATVRGNMHDDPIVYAVCDWVSWAVGVTAFAVLAIAKSVTFSLF